MSKLKIEFFHDVICSFCFPMSYNMRRLVEEVDGLEITHRSFALMPKEESFDIMFGNRKDAKNEILTHWQQANTIDEKKRFNIEGMREKDFLFPSSMIPLRASKAASLVGGEDKYWDMFDSLQKALFEENLDINNLEVIYDRVRSIDIDFDKWKEVFENGEAQKQVDEDLSLVSEFAINSAPTLIINRKYQLNGAYPYERLKAAIEELKTKES